MRRFIVKVKDCGVVGVECDDYNWGMFGLLFTGEREEKGQRRWQPPVILGIAPTRLEFFYELPKGLDFPDGVTIYTERAEGHLNANTD